MSSYSHFKLEQENPDTTGQILAEYRESEKIRIWKRPDTTAKFFVNLLIDNVRFNHSMSMERKKHSAPPDSISQHFRYLQGIGGIEYKTGENRSSFYKFLDAAHTNKTPEEKFNVYIYPNTEVAVRFACRNFHNLNLDEFCKNGNFYHFHLNFPKIILLVFAEKEYFDMLFEDVKKSDSPVLQLGLDLSQNKDFFILHQELKKEGEFPYTGIIQIAKDGFLVSAGSEDESDTKKFIESNTNGTLLPLSYLLFSSDTLPESREVQQDFSSLAPLIRKIQWQLYCMLALLAVVMFLLMK